MDRPAAVQASARPKEMSDEEMLKDIRDRAKSGANARLKQINQTSRAAMNAVSAICASVVGEMGGNYVHFGSNGETANTGMSSTIGIVHQGDQSKKFAPRIEIRALGDELTITIDGLTMHRTSLSAPELDSAHMQSIRSFYIKGAHKLIEDE